MAFIRIAREDNKLRARIEALSDNPGVEEISACASGYDFTDAELREAFKLDWLARWAHIHARRAGTSEP